MGHDVENAYHFLFSFTLVFRALIMHCIVFKIFVTFASLFIFCCFSFLILHQFIYALFAHHLDNDCISYFFGELMFHESFNVDIS